MAKLTLLNAQQVLGMTQAALMIATRTEERVQAARDAAQHDYDAKRSTLTRAVSNAYVRGTEIGGSAVTSEEEYIPRESARLLAGSALDHAQSSAHAASDRLAQADTALAQAKEHTARAAVSHHFAQSSVEDATQQVAKAGRLTTSSDVSPTVMGDAVLTPDEIVAWYRSEGVIGYVAAVDLQTLAQTYIDEATAEQVRGDVAFAQSIVETGAFTSPLTTHNNFAGIGACDTCDTGFAFDSPVMGIRAQVQLLRSYADKTVRTRTLAHPAVGSDPDTLGVRGCCPTWNALTGTWASDPNYGPKLMTVYLSMLQYALLTRTQTLG